MGPKENREGVVKFVKVETDKEIRNVLRRPREIFRLWYEGQLGPHFPAHKKGKLEVLGAQRGLARPCG